MRDAGTICLGDQSGLCYVTDRHTTAQLITSLLRLQRRSASLHGYALACRLDLVVGACRLVPTTFLVSRGPVEESSARVGPKIGRGRVQNRRLGRSAEERCLGCQSVALPVENLPLKSVHFGTEYRFRF